jgi:Calx-beta domain
MLQVLDQRTGAVLARRAVSVTSYVSIRGADGRVDNTLTVDLSGGAIAVPGGVRWDGGHGGYNTLAIKGGRAGREIYAPRGPHDGTVRIGSTSIAYADIAPMQDTVPAATFTLNATAASEPINIVDGPLIGGVQTSEINSGTSGTFEKVDFAHKTTVIVNGGGGNDTYTVDNPSPAAGLSVLQLQSSPAASSTASILATSIDTRYVGGGNDTVRVGNAGHLSGILAPLTLEDPPAILNVTLDGSADSAPEHVTATEAAPYSRDSESNTDPYQVLTGLAPAQIGLENDDLGGLTVDAGSGGNTFTIAQLGESMVLNTGTGNDTTTIASGTGLVVHGQAGDDTVNIGQAGSTAGVGAVSVDDAGGRTSLTMGDSADSTARNVTVGPGAVSGLTTGPISYADVSDLMVDGGSGADSYSVTPSPSTAFTLNAGGPGPPSFPGDVLGLDLTGASVPTLSASTDPAAGVNGSWSFGNRASVTFSHFESLNPTAVSVAGASATTPTSGSSPLSFAATLLAPSSQQVSVDYATADGTATVADGDYQSVTGTLTFAPGVTSQSVPVSVLADGGFQPNESFTLNLSNPVGAVIQGGQATGTIVNPFPAPTGVTAPQSIAPPQLSGTAAAGNALTCSTGTWANTPTAYSYQWSRNGTPLVGATGSNYQVQTLDEGTTLTCTVTASNSAGQASATSAGSTVQVPFVPRCPRASGSLAGRRLGLVRLGMTRRQAHAAYRHSSNRGRRYEDFFCLTPIGVRVGYGSPALVTRLARGDRARFKGRVVWISTSNPYYGIDGVRPGATLASARTRLKHGNLLHIGFNHWYLAPAGASTAVLKVRRGIVQEIGIADTRLTRNREAELQFMTSFR